MLQSTVAVRGGGEYNGAMKFLGILLPIIIIATLVIIGIGVGMYFEKKRREALEKVAADLGLEFFPQGIPGLLGMLQGFALFNTGRRHSATNTIRGVTDDVELAIFDLTYTTGSGKHSHTHRQTVIRFASSRLNLPDFTVSPEGFFHKIVKLFGVKDINFAEDPGFSSSFLLQGAGEAEIRQLFGPGLREWFSQRKGITAAGRGNQLFFFRAGQRVNPDKIPGLLEEGFQFFKLVAMPASEEMPPSS
ncbi:MAG: hypothetical protein IAF94_11595 [Pirellulaceae bacterium]|nr:hypothetical protein [Pirellulaceae bacterium]